MSVLAELPGAADLARGDVSQLRAQLTEAAERRAKRHRTESSEEMSSWPRGTALCSAAGIVYPLTHTTAYPAVQETLRSNKKSPLKQTRLFAIVLQNTPSITFCNQKCKSYNSCISQAVNDIYLVYCAHRCGTQQRE